MPERAQHIPPPPPLDEQVDQLLADVATNDDAVGNAAPADEDHDFASPDQLLDDVNASMQALESEAVAAADAEVQHLAAAVADASSNDTEPPHAEPAAAAQQAVPTPAAAPSPAPDDDFAAPDAIQKLDEKLAASAQELSDHAASLAVDDEPAPEPAVAADAAAARPVDDAALAADTEADAEAGAHVEPATEPAAAQPASSPTAAEPTPAPTAAVAPAPAAPARPDTDRATPKPAAPAPAAAAAPAVEKVVSVAPTPKPAPRQYSVGRVLAGPLVLLVRPIANYTLRLSPTVRQTIGYAAIITIFQAACLWGFLVFRGPPGEPAPTGEGTVLRRVGDDAEHEARAKAESAHAKPAPKPAAKSDTNAKTAKSGGH